MIKSAPGASVSLELVIFTLVKKDRKKNGSR